MIQIKNLVKNIKLINFEYGGKAQQSQVDGMVEQAVFDFVRDMCEKQIDKCALGTERHERTKNVCDGK